MFIIFLLMVTTTLFQMSPVAATSAFGNSQNKFAQDLVQVMLLKNPNENVVYSPASIQTCLTLAFLGSGGETAQEMLKGLHLENDDRTSIAESYGEFIKSHFGQLAKENSSMLNMANAIFVASNQDISSAFKTRAIDSFKTQIEQLDFNDPEAAVNTINSWVEKQTNNKIHKIVDKGAIDPSQTMALLVNAIYFKGMWLHPFIEEMTRKSVFRINEKLSVPVDMMFQRKIFKYGALERLDATAIELPYKDSDLSMLILLPNQIEGLKKLEEKLIKTDLNMLTLGMGEVDVVLPRFKVEFAVDMMEPLKELGMSDMFESSANFSELLTNPNSFKISTVEHMAFVEVNEAQTEAAGATSMNIAMSNTPQFYVDHPFVFAIRNSEAVFFTGHVVKFEA